MEIESATSKIPKVALAGSVGSSRRTLLALIRHKFPIVGVLGLSPTKSQNVCGYCRLDDLALDIGAPFVEFGNINHPSITKIVQNWAPDVLFIVGLSQIVKRELLKIPKMGCVGFHPTWLPEGRGRAPVAWLILENRPGAATFFMMDEGVDSGPIFVQEPFQVTKQDYASDVIAKLELAIDKALDRWLPQLKSGIWAPVPQNEVIASYYGRRAPCDGLIQWHWPAIEIYNLIRAASYPHPGAYTFVKHKKLVIWRAQIESKLPFRGVPGRILDISSSKGFLVQTGSGLLWLEEVEFPEEPNLEPNKILRIGTKLGYSCEDEIFHLIRQVADLESRLQKLEKLSK